jgi:lysozyme
MPARDARVALAFASDKGLLDFVAKHKEKFQKARAAWKDCKAECAESTEKLCTVKCVISKLKSKPTKAEDEESALAEIFESFEEAEVESDAGQSINQAGLNLIKSFEGFRSCVYKDAVGLPTIGYGHLIKSGEHFTCITEAQAESLLRKDVGSAESCISGAVKVSLNSNQFSALVSWAFNVGCGNVRSSTLVQLLNQGDKNSVCTQLARWNKAGGKELPGLTRRRQAECNLFRS